ncbi:Na+/H+ antiporter subunit B [candidate division KSB1 bacterium]|nr:Na+/H+ antiporter subunit B [candidate division KSB1 bacterium]
MRSLILRTAARQLLPIFIIISIIIMLRGHNAPGGGFIGGLIAASAYILYDIAYGVVDARRVLRMDPLYLIGLGLACALGSGIPSFLIDSPFTAQEWITFTIPFYGKFAVTSPLVFDLGVYLTVIGVLLTIVFSLAEE